MTMSSRVSMKGLGLICSTLSLSSCKPGESGGTLKVHRGHASIATPPPLFKHQPLSPTVNITPLSSLLPLYITHHSPIPLSLPLTSTLELLALSKLPLTPTPLLLLLLLPLLFRLASSGSVGCNPLALANRFRMSVRLTTPFSRPDMCCPGKAEAETEAVALGGWKGGEAWGRDVVR